MNSPPLSVSNPTNGNGSRATTSSIAASTHLCAPLRTAMFSVQPVNTSVAVSVRANSPARVGPQWTTRSASMKPGACSCSSPALRTVIELRSSGPALVADSPLGLAASLVGLRSRSIVAPETCSSCAPLPVSAASRRIPRRPPAWATTGPWSPPDTCPRASRPAATHRSAPSACHSRRSVPAASAPPISPGPCASGPWTAPGGRWPGTTPLPRPARPESIPWRSSTTSHNRLRTSS